MHWIPFMKSQGHFPKVTKMGSIAGHRIGYRVLRSQRHIPSKTWPKFPAPGGVATKSVYNTSSLSSTSFGLWLSWAAATVVNVNPVSFYLLLFEFHHKLSREWHKLLRGLCHAIVKVVVLGAELITKSFPQLFTLGLSSVFESSIETSSLVQWKPLFYSVCLCLFP